MSVISEAYFQALQVIVARDKEIEQLKAEIDQLNSIIKQQDETRIKLAKSC